MGKVAIILGSDSDLEAMSDAARILEKLGIEYKLTVSSAHRTPENTAEFAKNAHNEFDVIIAGAGGAAHLPGVIAASTLLPVIGVPMKTPTLNGIDSLYSIVQMPPGIPVATVGIGASKNAGLLAAQIIALKDKEVEKKLVEFRQKQSGEVLEKARKLEELGWDKYLETK